MKRIFFVLFAVAVVFGLCACNDSNTDTPSIEDVSVNDISNEEYLQRGAEAIKRLCAMVDTE